MRDSVNQGYSRQPFIYAQKLAYDLGFRLENKDLSIDKPKKVKYNDFADGKIKLVYGEISL